MNGARVRLCTAGALVAAAVAAFALPGAAAGPNAYVATYLVSDEPGMATTLDPDLVNAWGLDARPTSPWWVSDNETDVSTLYRADGSKVAVTVSIPGGAPTGLVANPGVAFVVDNGVTSAPALFLFDTEEGIIAGWNPTVDPANAIVAVAQPGADYKGLAVAGSRLYAADFHNARVDVFDGSFDQITDPEAFIDPKIPDGFAPFGIQNVAGEIVVTYAKQDADAEDEVAGQGLGFVDRFDTNGNLLGRIATRGQLNAPWGIALAPSNFGAFSGDLLIGNFGDGEINAYEPQGDGSYERVGALRTPGHKSLLIDGLWALQFGKGAPANGPTNALFFTAGPDDEEHGLFGSITTD